VSVAGTVYLLHFDKPYRHAGHYLGWTEGELSDRIAAHLCGRGARLLAVVVASGISFDLARVWPGDRHLERRLKKRGGAARLCPLCREHGHSRTGDRRRACFAASIQ
jgi:hypothetical protein